MNLADCMDEIATQVDTIDGLRVYAWPVPSITPPAAVMTYPGTYEFDATYGRGMDRLSLLLAVVVGRADQRSARDRLGAYVDGSGSSSIKAVVEAGTYTAFHTVRVVGVDFGEVTIAGTAYVGATFELDITGQGTA